MMDRQQSARSREPLDAILSSGFVGCLQDAPEDLATNYKAYLTDALAEKHRAG